MAVRHELCDRLLNELSLGFLIVARYNTVIMTHGVPGSSADDDIQTARPRKRIGPILAVGLLVTIACLWALVSRPRPERLPPASNSRPALEVRSDGDISSTEPLPPASQFRPLEVRSEGYVSSETCQSCHRSEYETWYASYHRTMTQAASPQSVMRSAPSTIRRPNVPYA